MQMRVEELEAACHAASFETSLRRAMAQTSPVCSVSASTDSSQSYIDADPGMHDPSAASSGFHQPNFEAQYRQQADMDHSYAAEYRDGSASQNGEHSDADAGGYTGRNGSDSGSQASTSETDISGLKQQRREWEAEKKELLREMGNLRCVAAPCMHRVLVLLCEATPGCLGLIHATCRHNCI